MTETKSSEDSRPLLENELEPVSLAHVLWPSQVHQLRRKQRLVTVLFCTAALIIGFILGILSHLHVIHRTREMADELIPTFGNEVQIWEHNLTFSQAPTRDSEAAWDSIVPIGRGFIHHEKIAPYISNIAVFHQLHCLHSLLVSYYTLEAKAEFLHDALLEQLGNTTSAENVTDAASKLATIMEGFGFEAFGTHTDTHHIRHCFDYLRRTLMCAADTNLEVVPQDKHTVNGWGEVKYCRSYDEVIRFAERWRNSSDTGIVT